MKLDILAIAAHPDDIELGIAGTLIKLANKGYKTGVVDLTQGEKGTRGNSAIRLAEAEEAAKIMKLMIRQNLSLPDTMVENNRENQLKIIKVIREYKPDIVLTSYWEAKHPDHIATSKLVSDACHYAGLANIDTGQQQWRPNQILYFHLPHYVPPSFIVDITDVYEERTKAILAYKSQFSPETYPEFPQNILSSPLFLKFIEARVRYYGSLIGSEFGEAYYIKSVLKINDIVNFFKTT